MKIFLVWSGTRSFEIAQALNDWLGRVIQAVKPFFSNEIEKGAKWAGEIDVALEGTSFGIVCLTPDNLTSPWIHYESGALSKTKDALIWTYLSDLRSGDVPQPLGRFQHTEANKADTLRLLRSINKRLSDVGGEPLSDAVLEENFEMFWPKLDKVLRGAKDRVKQIKSSPTERKQRDEESKLDEILELLRNQERHRDGNQLVHREQRLYKRRVLLAPVAQRKNAEKFCEALSLIRGITAGISDPPIDGILTLEFVNERTLTERQWQRIFDIGAEVAGWSPYMPVEPDFV